MDSSYETLLFAHEYRSKSDGGTRDQWYYEEETCFDRSEDVREREHKVAL